MGKKEASTKIAIKKLIFFLNNALPDENASIWVKAEEIHERLIHAGVSRSLPLHLVQELRNHHLGQD